MYRWVGMCSTVVYVGRLLGAASAGMNLNPADTGPQHPFKKCAGLADLSPRERVLRKRSSQEFHSADAATATHPLAMPGSAVRFYKERNFLYSSNIIQIICST